MLKNINCDCNANKIFSRIDWADFNDFETSEAETPEITDYATCVTP
jgi:hypothetical protein